MEFYPKQMALARKMELILLMDGTYMDSLLVLVVNFQKMKMELTHVHGMMKKVLRQRKQLKSLQRTINSFQLTMKMLCQ